MKIQKKNEIMKLNTQMNHYKQIVKEQQQQIVRLNAEIENMKTTRCHMTNEIIKYKSKHKKQIIISTDIKQKQLNMQETMQIHMNRLQAWNNCTIKLQNQYEQKQQETISMLQLLDSYTNCMKLLRTQQSRSEDIGEYAISLSKSKKVLKNAIKQY
eukprot:360266_1